MWNWNFNENEGRLAFISDPLSSSLLQACCKDSSDLLLTEEKSLPDLIREWITLWWKMYKEKG